MTIGNDAPYLRVDLSLEETEHVEECVLALEVNDWWKVEAAVDSYTRVMYLRLETISYPHRHYCPSRPGWQQLKCEYF